MCQCHNYCPHCGQKTQPKYHGYQYGWPYTWPNYGPNFTGTAPAPRAWEPTFVSKDTSNAVD